MNATSTKKSIERCIIHMVELGHTWPNVSFSLLGVVSLLLTFPLVSSICLVILAIRLLRMPEGEMRREPIKNEQKIVSLPTCATHYEFIEGDLDQIVVLVHGFSGDMGHTRPLANLIHENTKASILIYDLVGRGFSSCRGRPHECSLFVSQLTELLLVLNIKTKIHLVGISLGGGVITEFARIFPHSVATISLVAPAGLRLSTGLHAVTKIPILPDILFRCALWSTVVAGLEHEWSEHSSQLLAMLSSYKDRVKFEPALGRSLLSTCRHFPFENLEHSFQMLGKNKIPLLLIWGDQDGTCPIDAAYDIANRLVPHAQLFIINGARHCVYSEFSTTVAQDIVTFLLEQNVNFKTSPKPDDNLLRPRIRYTDCKIKMTTTTLSSSSVAPPGGTTSSLDNIIRTGIDVVTTSSKGIFDWSKVALAFSKSKGD